MGNERQMQQEIIILQQEITILLVEDNECDITIAKETFQQANVRVELCIARSGEDAIDFLYKEGNYKNADTPDIIFLDLNLPLMSGFDFLDIVNQNDDLRMIPTVVMTTSNNRNDINNAYQRCISCYLTKPMDINEFEKMILDVMRVVEIVQLPYIR